MRRGLVKARACGFTVQARQEPRGNAIPGASLGSRSPEPAMTRRCWLCCCAWSVGWMAWTGAGQRIGADHQQATLNELLRSVLKCRRPVEFDYVDLVTAKVNQ